MWIARGFTLGEAYRKQLERYTEINDETESVMVSCYNPVKNKDSYPDSCSIDDWKPVLNLGREYNRFTEWDFNHEGRFGSTGKDWINDRIYELHEGFYADRIDDKIDQITDRLKHGMHGSSTNALVVQVFNDQDLEQAVVPRPNASDMACLTQLQLKPIGNQLHLYQVFRSQYVDLKAFGNLVAGATLLQQVANEAGYDAGVVYMQVNNTTTYNDGNAVELHRALQKEPVEI